MMGAISVKTCGVFANKSQIFEIFLWGEIYFTHQNIPLNVTLNKILPRQNVTRQNVTRQNVTL